MIDSSEKRNRRLGSELQNSHVCEKCDPNSVSIKHGLRSVDHGLRTGYKTRTRSKMRTTE